MERPKRCVNNTKPKKETKCSQNVRNRKMIKLENRQVKSFNIYSFIKFSYICINKVLPNTPMIQCRSLVCLFLRLWTPVARLFRVQIHSVLSVRSPLGQLIWTQVSEVYILFFKNIFLKC